MERATGSDTVEKTQLRRLRGIAYDAARLSLIGAGRGVFAMV